MTTPPRESTPDGSGRKPAQGERAAVIRGAVTIGVATGAYGLSFGALAASVGLSLAETCALSLFMFTGASQFALVGVLSGGGGALAAAVTAVMLGTRNALYGLRLAPLLRVRGPRRVLAAHLVIDESTAMAIGRDDPAAGRLGFWATGIAVFLCWNLATFLGAVGARAINDPRQLGLDAAAPAAFLALLAPRLRGRTGFVVAGAGVTIALAAAPIAPAGVPVLLAAAAAVVLGWRGRRADDPTAREEAPRTAPADRASPGPVPAGDEP